jgi:hypothetical protein
MIYARNGQTEGGIFHSGDCNHHAITPGPQTGSYAPQHPANRCECRFFMRGECVEVSRPTQARAVTLIEHLTDLLGQSLLSLRAKDYLL